MAKNKREPIAFLSYVRDDDKHDNGRISQITERLSAEIRMQTGQEFPIFQDRNDIKWGQNWKERIDESIEGVTFFIPIITPSYFQSPACCDELLKFVGVQKRLKRTDLILPIYYVTAEELDDSEEREQSEVAKTLYDHQYKDWRELRFKPLTDPMISQALAEMAAQIKLALKNTQQENKKNKPIPQREILTSNTTAQTSEDRNVMESKVAKSEQASVQRTEIPVVIVDAMHRGDYPTINEAIKAVKPGTKILVKPGLYNEGIIIDKPLEIIGDGEREQIIIQVKDKDVVNFSTSMGKVSNMTLKQLGGEFYTVDITQGRLDLEGCDITSQGLAGIGIHDWADPIIRRNIIHGGKASGISIYENGQGTIEDNDVFNNVNSGIVMQTGANSLIRKNRIRDGKASGILVHENGQGTIEDNDIFNNTLAGIEIRGANPLIRKNRIRDGKQGGIMACEDSQGTIEDNDIYNNSLAGIEIQENANPTIQKNRIVNGKQGGILIHTNGKGIIEDNDILNNFYSGTEVRVGGSPYVKNNRIKNNISFGFYIHDKGEGKYEGNDLQNNGKGPWSISEDSKNLIVQKNNIES